MPDEDGLYTIDDMKLSRKQMLEYFDLIPREHLSGLPEYKWPTIEARGTVPCRLNRLFGLL